MTKEIKGLEKQGERIRYDIQQRCPGFELRMLQLYSMQVLVFAVKTVQSEENFKVW